MKFTLDSPVFSMIDQITDLLVAGFLWLVFSAPLVTIGPASAALYYTIVKVIRRKRETVTKSFLHAFLVNLRQGVGITLLYMVYGGLFFLYSYLLRYGEIQGKRYMAVAGGIIIVSPLLFTLPYIFPVLSRFQLKTGRIIQYALHMSVRHFMITFVLLFMLSVIGILIYFIPFFLVILPGVYVYLSSFLIERVFRWYLAAEREKYKEGEALPWYLEEEEH